MSGLARAQAPNDHIENRRVLALDETVASNTVDCTVQRQCVSKQLTAKKVEYHNDQWFEFTPGQPGRYFVNVAAQHCRYLRGIQLVVVQGLPCQPATYKLLTVTSLGTQDDVFVTLDSLEAGQPYLLNVDGYAHDLCRFQLQVSRTPKGIPVAVPLASAGHVRSGRLVEVGWYLPDSPTANYCQLWRRNTREQTSVRVARVPVPRNGYSRQQVNFSALDTLPGSPISTSYEYRVVAEVPAGPPLLVATHSVIWTTGDSPLIGQSPVRAEPAPVPASISLPLARFKPGTEVLVEVSDALTGRVLALEHLIQKKKTIGQLFELRRFFPDGARLAGVRLLGTGLNDSSLTLQLLY